MWFSVRGKACPEVSKDIEPWTECGFPTFYEFIKLWHPTNHAGSNNSMYLPYLPSVWRHHFAPNLSRRIGTSRLVRHFLPRLMILFPSKGIATFAALPEATTSYSHRPMAFSSRFADKQVLSKHSRRVKSCGSWQVIKGFGKSDIREIFSIYPKGAWSWDTGKRSKILTSVILFGYSQITQTRDRPPRWRYHNNHEVSC
jgi:hypothetical protein